MARKSGWRGENGEDRNVGLEPDRDRSRCRVCAGYRGNRGLHENLWLRQANGVSSEQCQLSAQARYQECVRYPTKVGRGRLASTIEHFWLEPELDRSAVAVLFWDAVSCSQWGSELHRHRTNERGRESKGCPVPQTRICRFGANCARNFFADSRDVGFAIAR